MVDPETENAWEIAAQLEQLLENARGALQIARPDMTSIEFRAALIAAVSRVVLRSGPLSLDVERLGEAFQRELRRERGRQRGAGEFSRAMAAYTGPDVA